MVFLYFKPALALIYCQMQMQVYHVTPWLVIFVQYLSTLSFYVLLLINTFVLLDVCVLFVIFISSSILFLFY